MGTSRFGMFAGALVMLAITGIAAPAGAATIAIGAQIPLSSSVFVVPIEITGADTLSFWQASLTYDPADLQINTGCNPFSGDVYCSDLTGPVTEGPFFGSLSPFNVFNPGFIILDPVSSEQTGLLLDVNDTFGGFTPPSGSGVLAYVEFLKIGTGNSEIHVTDPTPAPLSAVPEPASVTLLASGVAALVAHRRRRRR